MAAAISELATMPRDERAGRVAVPTAAPSFDRFGRRIDYLRLSLTVWGTNTSCVRIPWHASLANARISPRMG
jgi:hypothetical protein